MQGVSAGRPGAVRLLPSLRLYSPCGELLRLPCFQSRLTPHSVVHWPELYRGRSPASVRSPSAGKGRPDRLAGLATVCSPLTGPEQRRSLPSSPLLHVQLAGSWAVQARASQAPTVPTALPRPIPLYSSQQCIDTQVVSDSPADQERVKSRPTLLPLCSRCPPPLSDVPRPAPGTSDPLQGALPSPPHLWAPPPPHPLLCCSPPPPSRGSARGVCPDRLGSQSSELSSPPDMTCLCADGFTRLELALRGGKKPFVFISGPQHLEHASRA